MAATNMTAQSKNITGIVAGGDGKFRAYDLAGSIGGGGTLPAEITNITVISDFGADWLYSSASSLTVSRASDGFHWNQYSGGDSYSPTWGYIEKDDSVSVDGIGGSLKYVNTGGRTNPNVDPATTAGGEIVSKQDAIDNPSNIAAVPSGGWYTWFLNNDRSFGIPEVAGCNRISFYTQIPAEFDRSLHHSGEPENYTMHFGTYSRDPDGSWGSGSNVGNHYYHWLNFQGTGNTWTKVIIDDKPQHEVGASDSDLGPDRNPTTGFNYIEGLTRFYFKIKDNLLTPPNTIRVDRVHSYHDSRPMTDKAATICLTPIGTTGFDVDFASIDAGSGASYVNTFEIKYSTSPITDANYSSAAELSGSPAFTGDYERYLHCEGRGMSISGASIIYFAIRQTDENTTDIIYAEYEVFS